MSSRFHDDPLFRETQAYPELFPVSFTHKEFPSSARVMADTGTPFGCLVTPFMPSSDRHHIVAKVRKNAENASKIARCDICTGYLNPYCDVTAQRWFCSLCGARNTLSRTAMRYRSTDPRLLPEVQHMMIDYQTADKVPETKPFVHVLLVQESMPLDSLNAVVDSLSSAISAVHPDIHIVLITFSNRIGVYRLSGGATESKAPEKSSKPDLSRQISTDSVPGVECYKGKLCTPTPPPVQHIHFTYPKSKDANESVFDLIGVSQSLSGGNKSMCAVSCPTTSHFDPSQLDELLGIKSPRQDNCSYGDIGERVAPGRGIVEGRDPAVDFALPNPSLPPGTYDREQGTIEPLLRIGEAINFWDACSRVGSCRSSFKSAVASLFDACPSVSNQQLFPGISAEVDTVPAGPGMGALNMFGPAMDAVMDWLTTQPAARGGDPLSATVDSYDDGTGFATTATNEKTVMETLLGALSSFGITSARNSPSVGDSGQTSRDSRAPCALVCGMQIHILLASSPDLPMGLHDSTPSDIRDTKKGLFNSEWVQKTAERASRHSICVNVWGVAPFASQVLGLSELSPLARMTGGKTFRFLLGTTPIAEQYRLSLQLARALSAQYASKAILKLRASQLVDFLDNGIIGHLSVDPLLPGVYRMACCSHDNTVASFLDYRGGTDGTEGAQLEHLVLQVAFSYETLVEADNDEPPFEVNDSDHSQCIDIEEGENYYGREETNGIPTDANASCDSSNGTSVAIEPLNQQHCDEGSMQMHCKGVPTHSVPDYTPPANTRPSLPTHLYGETENAVLPDADSLTPDAAYRQFSERVCRVYVDGAFSRKYRRDMAALKEKNCKSRAKNFRDEAVGNDLTGGFLQSALGFSHKKRLISVRRLRIITIAVECVNKVPRLLGGTYAEIVAVMVTREVLYNVDIDRTNSLNGGVVALVGGMYEWAKKLSKCAAKGYLTAKLGRKYGNKKSDSSFPSHEEFKSLVAEAVEAASKDAITQTSLYVIFGAMSRIIGGHSEDQTTLTIGGCIAHYLGESKPDVSLKSKQFVESAIPSRQKANSSYAAPSQSSPISSTFVFSDSFAEVVSVALTQDANIAQRYLHPELLPVRDDGPAGGLSTDKDSGVSSLVVEPRLIPPNRSGLAWSMMSDGSPMFLLDAGDEIILYRNLSPSNKKPFAGASSRDAPLAEHLVSDTKWLVNDINRRINISNYVPRFHYARSGTASSGYMANHLIDLSGDENSIMYMINDIKEKLCNELLKEYF